jgi:hypothetical protein
LSKFYLHYFSIAHLSFWLLSCGKSLKVNVESENVTQAPNRKDLPNLAPTFNQGILPEKKPLDADSSSSGLSENSSKSLDKLIEVELPNEVVNSPKGILEITGAFGKTSLADVLSSLTVKRDDGIFQEIEAVDFSTQKISIAPVGFWIPRRTYTVIASKLLNIKSEKRPYFRVDPSESEGFFYRLLPIDAFTKPNPFSPSGYILEPSLRTEMISYEIPQLKVSIDLIEAFESKRNAKLKGLSGSQFSDFSILPMSSYSSRSNGMVFARHFAPTTWTSYVGPYSSPRTNYGQMPVGVTYLPEKSLKGKPESPVFIPYPSKPRNVCVRDSTAHPSKMAADICATVDHLSVSPEYVSLHFGAGKNFCLVWGNRIPCWNV